MHMHMVSRWFMIRKVDPDDNTHMNFLVSMSLLKHATESQTPIRTKPSAT